jgi:hypothetical protein
MFSHKHYVPVIRWRPAEQLALRHLRTGDKVHLSPLIELIPKSFTADSIEKKGSLQIALGDAASQISACWGRAPVFLDLSHLETGLPKAALPVLASQARIYHVCSIPVTNFGMEAEFQSAVASLVSQDRNGVCIRLTIADIRSPRLQERLRRLLHTIGVGYEESHLIVDLGRLNDSAPNYRTVCSRLPDLPAWRTFTVLSGAFPKDLSGFPKNNEYELERGDWLNWAGQVAERNALPRKPAYGDYTVQYAEQKPEPRRPHPSASIRYTSERHWVIMRGEDISNPEGPGSAQWPAQAQLLCMRPEFCGAKFSYGDEYIVTMSKQSSRTGRPQDWILAGINHHLAFTARQIANLSAS